LFYKKVWVSYSDLSNFVVGYDWQLICQVSPWLLLKNNKFKVLTEQLDQLAQKLDQLAQIG
jgi:hypothetical protein